MIRFYGLSACGRGGDRHERLVAGRWGWLAALAGCLLLATMALASPASLGEFEGQTDVGGPLRAGSATFDAASGDYHLKGSGANIWGVQDAFHFVWRWVTGDVTLTTNVGFPQAGGKEHRKAGVMVRQNMGPGAPFAGAFVHGDGLAALQYRLTEGGAAQEIRSNISKPETIRLVRLGNTFSLWASRPGGQPELAGSVEVPLRDPVYMGLAASSYDPEALEEAVFSHVNVRGRKLTGVNLEPRNDPPVESSLEVISSDGSGRHVVYRVNKRIECANWSPDGKLFVFNSNGQLYTLPVTGGEPKHLSTGPEYTWSNDDHVISPDGKWVVISNSGGGATHLFVVPITGGEPRQVTPNGPSFAHGWSPDGKTIAYCGARNGNFDIYTISVEGGEEQRLTDAPGLDDGPDYSPDGKYIFFNSERTGLHQVWRMKTDGSEQVQLTNDNHANWMPHPSPDGKWLAFSTYDTRLKGHPTYEDMMLRIMPIGGGEIRVLAKVFGGGGTMNTPSWSPDSKHLAFISYRLLKP